MSSQHEVSRPIRRVQLNITLDADKGFLQAVSKKTQGSKVSGGRLSVTITASDPQEALEKVRRLAASIKGAQEPSKDFK